MTLNYTRLLQFNRQFSKFYTRQFAPFSARTGLSMRDVAELRGLAKSQVSQAVDLLTAEGILCRQPDEADRRLIHLRITPVGSALAQECREIQTACGKRLLQGLSPQQTAQLETLLDTVLENGAHLLEEDFQ